MRIAATKNTVRGIIFGTINKIIIIIMPFMLRSIIIYKIGIDYAGLSNLFSSILQVLNMAELGFSSAATFSLYKPIAQDDTKKVCQLITFYRIVYYTVGTVVLLIGLM